MDAQIFKRHLKEFYPLITKLICCDQVCTFPDMRFGLKVSIMKHMKFQSFNLWLCLRWMFVERLAISSANNLLHLCPEAQLQFFYCIYLLLFIIGIFVQAWSTGRELDILKAHVWRNSLLPRHELGQWETASPKATLFWMMEGGSRLACCARHVFPCDLLYFWAIYLFPGGDDASIRTLHSRIVLAICTHCSGQCT